MTMQQLAEGMSDCERDIICAAPGQVIRAASVEADARSETQDGVRWARNRLLDELPGVAFALVTLEYIMQSLASLAW